MHKKNILFISFIASFIGMLLYAWHREWIVIKLPTTHNFSHRENQSRNLKKTITLYYWHAEKWQRETTELIWTENDLGRTVEYIVNGWLSLLDEEKIMDKRVSVQTTLITQSEYAYLSFDRYPFNKELCTYEKLQWIEGLLKTLRENGVKLQGIYFLVQHQLMIDNHLDFSNAWPLNGFCQQ